MIGSLVKISKPGEKKSYETQERGAYQGRVRIYDKVITSKSQYHNAAIMNEASFTAYLGKTEDTKAMIVFRPEDIVEIIHYADKLITAL